MFIQVFQLLIKKSWIKDLKTLIILKKIFIPK